MAGLPVDLGDVEVASVSILLSLPVRFVWPGWPPRMAGLPDLCDGRVVDGACGGAVWDLLLVCMWPGWPPLMAGHVPVLGIVGRLPMWWPGAQTQPKK